MTLLDEFKAYVAAMPMCEEKDDTMEYTHRYRRAPDGGYWCQPEDSLSFDDFNKEIVPPGAMKRFPEGACGIRSDDDFWIEAVFPFKFTELTIEEIVSVVWPGAVKPVFKPDVMYKPKASNDEDEDD
jgi:hypothetical protein